MKRQPKKATLPYKGSLLSQKILSEKQKYSNSFLSIFLTVTAITLMFGVLLLGVVFYIVVVLWLSSLMSR